MACVDENTVPYPIDGIFSVYHLALENSDHRGNYGIYANGLVESCSKRYLLERSDMKLIRISNRVSDRPITFEKYLITT